MHHLVTDGVSQPIISNDFIVFYHGEVLPDLRLQYKDYSLWQHNKLNTGEIEKQRVYWLERFRGKIPDLEMPLDFPRKDQENYKGGRVSDTLALSLVNSIYRLAKAANATLFMVYLAVYHILLSKYTRQQDIIIGTGISGRNHADLEQIIGIFVNLLALPKSSIKISKSMRVGFSWSALRAKFSRTVNWRDGTPKARTAGGVKWKEMATKPPYNLMKDLGLRNISREAMSFREFLEEVKQTALNAYKNQDYQFEDLVDQLRLERRPGKGMLFDLTFTLENSPGFKHHFNQNNNQESFADTSCGQGGSFLKKYPPDLKILPYYYQFNIARYDLLLKITGSEQERCLVLIYRTSLFKRNTIEQLKNHYIEILSQVASNMDIKLEWIYISHTLLAANSKIFAGGR
jgi:non-ribosomal peptide synthetase component F